MKSHWDQLNSKLIKENSVKLGKTQSNALRPIHTGSRPSKTHKKKEKKRKEKKKKWKRRRRRKKKTERTWWTGGAGQLEASTVKWSESIMDSVSHFKDVAFITFRNAAQATDNNHERDKEQSHLSEPEFRKKNKQTNKQKQKKKKQTSFNADSTSDSAPNLLFS